MLSTKGQHGEAPGERPRSPCSVVTLGVRGSPCVARGQFTKFCVTRSGRKQGYGVAQNQQLS